MLIWVTLCFWIIITKVDACNWKHISWLFWCYIYLNILFVRVKILGVSLSESKLIRWVLKTPDRRSLFLFKLSLNFLASFPLFLSLVSSSMKGAYSKDVLTLALPFRFFDLSSFLSDILVFRLRSLSLSNVESIAFSKLSMELNSLWSLDLDEMLLSLTFKLSLICLECLDAYLYTNH